MEAPCNVDDELNGDGTYHTRLNLICSTASITVERFGWHRSGCTWEFNMRFAGACGKAAPPAGSAAARAVLPQPSWLGDGVSDRLCNNTASGWDHGDCRQATGGAHPGGSAGGTSGAPPWWRRGCVVSSHRSSIATVTAAAAAAAAGMFDKATTVGKASGVTSNAVVWVAIGATLGASCLLCCLACLCCRIRRLVASTPSSAGYSHSISRRHGSPRQTSAVGSWRTMAVAMMREGSCSRASFIALKGGGALRMTCRRPRARCACVYAGRAIRLPSPVRR